MIVNLLLEKKSPKDIHIYVLGFLESSTSAFMKELWEILHDASQSLGGIPKKMLNEEKSC